MRVFFSSSFSSSFPLYLFCSILTDIYPVRRQISPYAAELRKNPTDAERKFRTAVRNRQIDSYKFRFQTTIEPFIADFLCVEAKLIVELDGGQHNEATDARRTRFLESRGYRVLRFWNNDVLEISKA